MLFFDATCPLEKKQKTVTIAGRLFRSISSLIHCFHTREEARIRIEQTNNGGGLCGSGTGVVVQDCRAKDISDVVLSRPGGELMKSK